MQSFNDDRAAPPYSGPASGSTPRPEQDNRPLPEGWTRQWDANYKQYFFVDTKANPPRSSWVHPLDEVQPHKTHGPPADSDSESSASSSTSSPSKRDMKRAKRAEKRAHREEKREERREDKHARKEEKRARKHEKRI
ncbi:hypothetical protein M407DRAFT_241345 [Tulasnella calospora MUT 4182]|uniref:WW domain-containing protein n=1 Tax=Tulasnella calospora MUT 4182 TaxID=1051891 RepID=A0A0C3LFA5_9AGAM|nr:hypothetical protein M407DRAFT_241345 [Tulasnella calospora MUT 4182]